ncbi:MAG: hypothetical protein AAFX93_16405 [Verrucomicrobiota bacterium]
MAADGFGASLQRRDFSAFADDFTNWPAAYPSGSPAPDTDDDGIADWWERSRGLSVGIDDSLLDPDFDGFNNIAERAAGTDPMDGDSFLGIDIETGAVNVIIQFTAIADIEYQIQFTSDFTRIDWQDGSLIPAGSRDRMISVSEPVSETKFFRVIALGSPE